MTIRQAPLAVIPLSSPIILRRSARRGLWRVIESYDTILGSVGMLYNPHGFWESQVGVAGILTIFELIIGTRGAHGDERQT